MKLISWNVNGLRAILSKGFEDIVKYMDADIFALQETKCQPEQVSLNINGYYQYFHSAEKKGYSSTAVFTKNKPITFFYDFKENGTHPLEGRIMTFEFENFFFVNAYVPNSKDELSRLDYRIEWEKDMLNHLISLDKIKPVIYCGDLNVAHNEIDIKNPNTNHFSAGFSDAERERMSILLSNGFTDTFRYLYPNLIKYTWWSYRYNARKNNAGWRIDYFIVSNRIKDKIIDAKIHTDILGSDHCPIELDIDL